METISYADLVVASRHSWGLAGEPYSAQHFIFCDAFALHVAKAYMAGELGFEVADRAMNELYSFSYYDDDRGMPEVAWAVFEAFDSGAFIHDGDSPDVDQELKYTRPQLAHILDSICRVNG
jgi:hypothetical protein